MKNVVTIRGLNIGEGLPKICVPMTGENLADIVREAVALVEAGAQLAEWRMDWFCGWNDEAQVRGALKELRNCLGELPLLATFRTKQEGGNAEITPEQYRQLYKVVLSSGFVDLIDLELFFDDTVLKELIFEARNCGVKTVLSNHDFHKTPPEEEILRRLVKMEELGADIAKIAVMPENAEDVAVLLKATAVADQKIDCPLITMSMGGKGVISRMAGQIFGSSVTFGSVGRTSAPGQVPLEQLKEVLNLVESIQ